MNKYENLDNFRKRTHVVEITLQHGEFKGKLRRKITGNCFGIDVLQSAIDEDSIFEIDSYEQIDCHFRYLGDDGDGEDWFKWEMKNDKGEVCEGEDCCSEFKRMIVGVTIIECTIDSR